MRDEFYAIDIASDGSILAAGRLDDGNSLDFLVAKFDSNGALDNTFSFNGYNLTDFDGGNDTGRDLLIQPDSKVLVGGSMSSGDEMTMARYNADGSLDVDFGTNGKVRTIVGTSAVIRKLALQQDGKIMAAGYSSEITSDGLLARYFSGINIGIGDVDAYIGSTLIYPNPITNNTVIVEYELKSVETVSIELYNLKGKRLSTLQSEAQENVGSYQKTLVLPKLSAGSYLLILNTTKGSVSIQLGVV